MRRLTVVATATLLSSCSTLPPTHDPEGCDRVREHAKRAGSDLVVDGDLFCAMNNGDCELAPTRIITGKDPRRVSTDKIAIHILRKEANAHSKELIERNEISFCYPPELWFPSSGHYPGRFYLRQEGGGRFHMAFYPRVVRAD